MNKRIRICINQMIMSINKIDDRLEEVRKALKEEKNTNKRAYLYGEMDSLMMCKKLYMIDLELIKESIKME